MDPNMALHHAILGTLDMGVVLVSELHDSNVLRP